MLISRFNHVNPIDAIDFDVLYSEIDLLSDVAMVICDLERGLLAEQVAIEVDTATHTENLIKSFRDAYLEEMRDSTPEARLLLEYYIAEKSIVRGCKEFIVNQNYNAGIFYFSRFLIYIQRLEIMMELWIRKEDASNLHYPGELIVPAFQAHTLDQLHIEQCKYESENYTFHYKQHIGQSIYLGEEFSYKEILSRNKLPITSISADNIWLHADRALDSITLYAPDMTFGVVNIENGDEKSQTLQCKGIATRLTIGHLREKLVRNERVAIVMHTCRVEESLPAYIKDTSQLTTHLDLIAQELVSLQGRYKPSNIPQAGTILDLQRAFEHDGNVFLQALILYAEKLDKATRQELLSWALEMPSLLLDNLSLHKDLLQSRYDVRGIFRCHGNLKLENMWMLPKSGTNTLRLQATDCIDFTEDYICIDIISDVALFMVDLWVHLPYSIEISYTNVMHFWETYSHLWQCQTGQNLSREVLYVYLLKKNLALFCAEFMNHHAPGEQLARILSLCHFIAKKTQDATH
jgi:aminoglycoside phosphotransferase family enzyme